MPRKQIQTFVFLDLETTGLIEGDKMPRITEISVVALPRHSMYVNSVNKTTPRDTQALSILVNPQRLIPLFVSELTGICDELVANQRPFDTHVYEMLNTFINRFRPPICFVSHNGDQFDFRILVWELGLIGKRFADDVLCLDMLDVFRAVMQPPNCSRLPNHRLRTVYTHLIRTEQPNAHCAMGDCLALMTCALNLVDPFVEWADSKARPIMQFRN